MRKRRHRWLDHTSEVQLQVEAESLAGLAAEAGRALGLLLLHDVPARPEGPAREIQVESVDREALLVDWLNEILFLAEVERWVAVEFDVLRNLLRPPQGERPGSAGGGISGPGQGGDLPRSRRGGTGRRLASGGDLRCMSRKNRKAAQSPKAPSHKAQYQDRPPAPPKAPPPSYPSVRLSPNLVEIPITARDDMNVPARVWADEELWKQISRDRTLHQLINVSTLPGITGTAQAMPDTHEGLRLPRRGRRRLPRQGRDHLARRRRVRHQLRRPPARLRDRGWRARPRPAGIADPGPQPRHPLGNGKGEPSPFRGRGSRPRPGRGVHLSGRARPCRLPRTSTPSRPGDRSRRPTRAAVSDRARQRGDDQLGTLGSGNHFVEVQVVDELFDEAAAEALRLRVGQVVVLIHTGSRGLGHQVCRTTCGLWTR